MGLKFDSLVSVLLFPAPFQLLVSVDQALSAQHVSFPLSFRALRDETLGCTCLLFTSCVSTAGYYLEA